MENLKRTILLIIVLGFILPSTVCAETWLSHLQVKNQMKKLAVKNRGRLLVFNTQFIRSESSKLKFHVETTNLITNKTSVNAFEPTEIINVGRSRDNKLFKNIFRKKVSRKVYSHNYAVKLDLDVGKYLVKVRVNNPADRYSGSNDSYRIDIEKGQPYLIEFFRKNYHEKDYFDNKESYVSLLKTHFGPYLALFPQLIMKMEPDDTTRVNVIIKSHNAKSALRLRGVFFSSLSINGKIINHVGSNSMEMIGAEIEQSPFSHGKMAYHYEPERRDAIKFFNGRFDIKQNRLQPKSCFKIEFLKKDLIELEDRYILAEETMIENSLNHFCLGSIVPKAMCITGNIQDNGRIVLDEWKCLE